MNNTLGLKALLIATLQRAILDCCGASLDIKRNDQLEAAEWIAETAFESTPYSFIWICGELDLDPNEMRLNINRLANRARTGEVIRSSNLSFSGISDLLSDSDITYKQSISAKL